MGIHPQISRATSTTLRSFALWSSGVSLLPGAVLAKAALRAQAELVGVDVFRRLIDPPFEFIFGFDTRHLAGYDAKDDFLVLGTKRNNSKLPARGVSYSRK